MNDSPAHRRTTALLTNRLIRWTARHQRSAAGHMLRGTCYGIGTGAVSLLAVWAQKHL
ncbi:hypothetical protein [Streptomyces lushanensis]|uniref:hypothetical protein n=1 Tax=Streptomyces lushanensis TaxID=1434255 RepID=UPI0014742CF5|nr:hypothetical protein [Streptomyces lushanensis]